VSPSLTQQPIKRLSRRRSSKAKSDDPVASDTSQQAKEGVVVGIDLGRYDSHICILERRTGQFSEEKVPSSAKSIAETLAPHRDRIDCVVMEAAANSFDLCRQLRSHGYPAILVDAGRTSPFLRVYRRSKTDKHDAFGLAQLVIHRAERTVWMRSAAASELAATLATRDALIGAEVALRTALQSHLASLGVLIKCYTRSKYLRLFKEGLAEISGYSILTELHGVLLSLHNTIADIDKRLKTRARADKTCQLLMTVPGVGPFIALRYLSLIDDPSRFTRSRDLGPYLGLVPRVHQSGNTKRHCGVSYRGSNELRRSLYMGAQVLLTGTKRRSSLRMWATQVAQRRGKKKAITALARKLAVIMHAVWRSGLPYRDEPLKYARNCVTAVELKDGES
jgi:transposase